MLRPCSKREGPLKLKRRENNNLITLNILSFALYSSSSGIMYCLTFLSKHSPPSRRSKVNGRRRTRKNSNPETKEGEKINPAEAGEGEKEEKERRKRREKQRSQQKIKTIRRNPQYYKSMEQMKENRRRS